MRVVLEKMADLPCPYYRNSTPGALENVNYERMAQKTSSAKYYWARLFLWNLPLVHGSQQVQIVGYKMISFLQGDKMLAKCWELAAQQN